jgi:hypothetical protein
LCLNGASGGYQCRELSDVQRGEQDSGQIQSGNTQASTEGSSYQLQAKLKKSFTPFMARSRVERGILRGTSDTNSHCTQTWTIHYRACIEPSSTLVKAERLGHQRRKQVRDGRSQAVDPLIRSPFRIGNLHSTLPSYLLSRSLSLFYFSRSFYVSYIFSLSALFPDDRPPSSRHSSLSSRSSTFSVDFFPSRLCSTDRGLSALTFPFSLLPALSYHFLSTLTYYLPSPIPRLSHSRLYPSSPIPAKYILPPCALLEHYARPCSWPPLLFALLPPLAPGLPHLLITVPLRLSHFAFGFPRDPSPPSPGTSLSQDGAPSRRIEARGVWASCLRACIRYVARHSLFFRPHPPSTSGIGFVYTFHRISLRPPLFVGSWSGSGGISARCGCEHTSSRSTLRFQRARPFRIHAAAWKSRLRCCAALVRRGRWPSFGPP